MRGIKRGIESVLFYWKRSLLFGAAFLVIAVILAFLASIQGNVAAAIEETGRRTDATLTIRVRDATAFSYDQDIYYPLELVRELETWEEVKGLDYLALANARGVDVKEVFSETQQSFLEASEEMGVDYYGSEAERNAGEITVIGSNDLEKTWHFKKRGTEVTEGEGIAPGNASQASAVVSERFLEWNMLEIGDWITLVNAFDDARTMKVKVVGTHSGNYDSGSVADAEMNDIYVPLDECLHFNGGAVVQTTAIVRDPKEIGALKERMQDFLGERYAIQEDSMRYLRAVTPLRGVQKVCGLMLGIACGILFLVLILVIGRMLLNLRKEIGLWRVLGETKMILLAQTGTGILLPIFAGVIAGDAMSCGLESWFAAGMAWLLPSFPDLVFRLSRRAIGQITGVTFAAAILILAVLFFLITGKETTELLREE